MERLLHTLACITVVAIAILNVACGKAFLFSLADVCEAYRRPMLHEIDSSTVTQIWLDSRDPDPEITVRNNGSSIEWNGNDYTVLSVIQCGVETLYICSVNALPVDGLSMRPFVSHGEENPLKLALTGKIVFDYFTPSAILALAAPPSVPVGFADRVARPLLRRADYSPPPPRIS